jgi:hypothetical protein
MLGVSTSKAVRIYKTYGDQAIERVRSNPYVLAKDIYGSASRPLTRSPRMSVSQKTP